MWREWHPAKVAGERRRRSHGAFKGFVERGVPAEFGRAEEGLAEARAVKVKERCAPKSGRAARSVVDRHSGTGEVVGKSGG